MRVGVGAEIAVTEIEEDRVRAGASPPSKRPGGGFAPTPPVLPSGVSGRVFLGLGGEAIPKAITRNLSVSCARGEPRDRDLGATKWPRSGPFSDHRARPEWRRGLGAGARGTLPPGSLDPPRSVESLEEQGGRFEGTEPRVRSRKVLQRPRTRRMTRSRSPVGIRGWVRAMAWASGPTR